jgi:hypothetical protein
MESVARLLVTTSLEGAVSMAWWMHPTLDQFGPVSTAKYVEIGVDDH